MRNALLPGVLGAGVSSLLVSSDSSDADSASSSACATVPAVHRRL